MEKPCTIIPVRPERNVAKSKDALFVLATVLMVAALAGCGGSSAKTAALLPPMNIEALPQGSMLQEPRTLAPGERLTVRDADGMRTTITCPEDGEACDITSGPDGAIQYTGGAPTVETVTYTAIELPEVPEGDLMLPEGVTTILAGTSRKLHDTFDTRTELMCPDDGPDCVVTRTEDGGAEATGGTPKVVTYTTLYLPSGHTLAEGTIPAGVVQPLGVYSMGAYHELACPADGEDCEIILGEFDFESTGGTPYLTAKYDQMVWQANNGPDGTSNGAHARGLRSMLQAGTNFGTVVGFGGGRTGGFHRTHTNVVSVNRAVAATASWASTDAAPTLGLTITNTGAGSFSVDGDSNIPSLGTGWNGVALGKTLPDGSTRRAVLYSDITKQPSGGTADTRYLNFGAWMEIPDDPAARTAYLMGAFAGSPATDSWTVNDRTATTGGPYSYRGPAIGVYSKATYTGSGNSRALASTKAGSFTATTAISANFGGSGNFNGVGGTITDFRENGESLGDWRIGLQSTAQSDSSDTRILNGNFENSGIGPAPTDYLSGVWRSLFFRGHETSGAPNYIVGSFRANTGSENNDSLIMVGAFATERRP